MVQRISRVRDGLRQPVSRLQRPQGRPRLLVQVRAGRSSAFVLGPVRQVCHAFRFARAALERVHPRGQYGEERLPPHAVVVELAEPAREGDLPALPEQPWDDRARLGRGRGRVARGEQVVDRELRLSVCRKPCRRPSVQRARGVTVAFQHREQVLPEQRVVAEPPSVGIEGHDELIGRGEVTEDAVGARALDDRVAQIGGHAVEDRRLQEERPDPRARLVEQLRVKVVADVGVPAGDAGRPGQAAR